MGSITLTKYSFLPFKSKDSLRRRVIKTFLFVLLLTVVGIPSYLTYKYQITRYTISKTEIDGMTVYFHEDSQTTEIINYLGGRGELSSEIKLKLYRQYVRSLFTLNKVKPPADIHLLEWEEVTQKLVDLRMELEPDKKLTREKVRELSQTAFEEAVRSPLQDLFTPNVYDNLWRMQEIAGGFKIRLLSEQDEFASKFVAYSLGTDSREFYDPVENTVFISYFNAMNTLFTEGSHSSQLNEDPVDFYLGLAEIYVITGYASLKEGIPLAESYNRAYRDPSSLESRGHGPDRQKLIEESGLIVVDKNTPTKRKIELE